MLKPRRFLVVVFILAELAAGAFFFHGHVLGDSGRFALGYFWTWDMFPNYPSYSARRSALGRTRSGKFVQVFPTKAVKFRRGRQDDITRFDLPRNDQTLRTAVVETLQSRPPGESEDPVTYVFLVEKYWPVRFNLPDELYRHVHGEENPHRHAWRILDEGPVEPSGDVRWTSSP